MFFYSSYDSVLIENTLEGYIWPTQGSELNYAVTHLKEPLQVQTST
jgi:hypothetical protein